jgi:hypothetical protein
MNTVIKFLHNSEINIQRWDQVVGDAINSRVYALSWYLTILHLDWHGLIYGDYDYVMPVIFSKKWGIEYTFQPIYSQQHGIFPPSSHEITSLFIQFLQKRFRYIDISLNSRNRIENEKIEIEERKNFLLPLENNYSDLYLQYTNDCKKNIKKAVRVNAISSTLSLEEFMDFKNKNKKISFNEDLQTRLEQIISQAIDRNSGFLYGAYSSLNELCGASFIIKDNYRYTILNSVSSEMGKKSRSMFAIIDAFIREHNLQPYLLDFEGSNIEGIAHFFHGFGAQPEIYQHIKYNNLPWFFKLLKK